MARNWDVYTASPPEYEQPIDVLERAREFIARVRRRYSGEHLVAVTHGDVIAFLILWAKAASISPEQKQDFRRLGLADKYPAPGSISTFVFRANALDELPGVEYVSLS
jgi:broad specificity phosphatase PhoE